MSSMAVYISAMEFSLSLDSLVVEVIIFLFTVIDREVEHEEIILA